MVGEGGGGLEELPSPKNKVKFLCSLGGKILPRPFDGHLKYVGGETRVIAVPRDITFSELMKKVNAPFDGDMVLKYQLIPGELDVLVSVKTDEDLKHMFDEYDRQENKGSAMLRTFLFPTRSNTIIENQLILNEPRALEQRYIDVVNGIIRSPRSRLSPINVAHSTATFSLSSACSSPNSPSPDPYTPESIHENRLAGGRVTMQRVHSSPSLCGLNNLQHGAQHVNQHYYNYNHNHHPHYHNNHHYSNLSSRPPLDPHKIVGVEMMGRSTFSHCLGHSHCSSRHHRGSGTCNKCAFYDEYFSAYGRLDRAENPPWSPRKNIWE